MKRLVVVQSAENEMDANQQNKRRDVRDTPIRKPSEPLPAIFDPIWHSGFTTTKRFRANKAKGAARDERQRERLRNKN